MAAIGKREGVGAMTGEPPPLLFTLDYVLKHLKSRAGDLGALISTSPKDVAAYELENLEKWREDVRMAEAHLAAQAEEIQQRKDAMDTMAWAAKALQATIHQQDEEIARLRRENGGLIAGVEEQSETARDCRQQWQAWEWRATKAEAALAQRTAELEGDGSVSSDPLKSLGLRKCLELQGETIALLKQELAQRTAERDRWCDIAAQRYLDTAIEIRKQTQLEQQLAERTAERDKAIDERLYWQTEYGNLEHALDGGWHNRAKDAEQQLAEARAALEALRPYLQHKLECATRRHYGVYAHEVEMALSANYDCTCGLAAILARPHGDPP